VQGDAVVRVGLQTGTVCLEVIDFVFHKLINSLCYQCS
jgi:hypothetical protein